MHMAENERSSAQYARQNYWKTRYEQEESREWLCGYDEIYPILQPIVSGSDHALVLGCGNSPFSAQLMQHCGQVTNIDYAESVINNMASKFPSMNWIPMDIRRLAFESKSFELVVEKATIDTLLVEERDPWHPSDIAKEQMQLVLNEVSRVLTDNGVFISITFSQPHFRLPFYAQENYGWSVAVHEIGQHFHHYVFVMKKGPFSVTRHSASSNVSGTT